MFRKLLIMLLILLCITNGVHLAVAQHNPEPIYTTNGNFLNLSWSADSATFVFQENVYLNNGRRDFGVRTTTKNWYTYNRQTGDIVQTDYWPFQPTLTSDQKQAIRLATIDAQESFIFSSPDGRFWAYLAEPPADWCNGWNSCGHPLAVYDQSTGKFQYIAYAEAEPPINYYHSDKLQYIPSGDLWDFEHGYNLKWSADSSTLYGKINTTGNADLPFRIAGFDTPSLTLTVDMFSDGYYAQGQTLYLGLYSILAVSSDGKRFLNDDFGLWMYDIDDVSKPRKITEPTSLIIGAGFDPQDANIVWYIDEHGLFQLDMITGHELLIDASIKSTPFAETPRFEKAWFAPDLSAIVLLYRDGDWAGPYQLQIYPMPPQARESH